ncbi:MAG: MerR family transcriptional regulator [Actinomycetes bacterium]|jgi:MerR family transcriptional regulator/heat shock protein HspR
MSPAKDASRAVYVISVAAELAGVHPQTLRNYERSGLLDPTRTAGGSRRFSEHDLDRLRRIQELTSEGLNLEGVRRVLALELEADELRRQVAALRDEHRRAIEELRRSMRREIVPLNQSMSLYRGTVRRGR